MLSKTISSHNDITVRYYINKNKMNVFNQIHSRSSLDATLSTISIETIKMEENSESLQKIVGRC